MQSEMDSAGAGSTGREHSARGRAGPVGGLEQQWESDRRLAQGLAEQAHEHALALLRRDLALEVERTKRGGLVNRCRSMQVALVGCRASLEEALSDTHRLGHEIAELRGARAGDRVAHAEATRNLSALRYQYDRQGLELDALRSEHARDTDQLEELRRRHAEATTRIGMLVS